MLSFSCWSVVRATHGSLYFRVSVGTSFFINKQAYFISRTSLLADTRSMKDKTYDKNDIDFKGFSS